MSADVRSRVGSYFSFFDFLKKWTADSEKQENKLVWPNINTQEAKETQTVSFFYHVHECFLSLHQSLISL